MFLTTTELARLGHGVRPDVFSTMLKHMALAEQDTGKKIYVRPDGGFRTHERQQQLYAAKVRDQERGQVYATATPGNSRHEYGAAYDLGIVGGTAADYEALAAIGRELGMDPGAEYGDPFHFQTRESLETVKAKYADLVRGRLRFLALTVGAIALVPFLSPREPSP